MRYLLWLPLLTACGGSKWTPADANGATQAARAELLLGQMCSDSGDCDPPQVRALTRSVFCNNASMLLRHGSPVPEGGAECTPE